MSKARARERAKNNRLKKLKRNRNDTQNSQPQPEWANNESRSIRGPSMSSNIKNIAIKAKGAARSR